ncbi:GtrA family protein [Paenibacillus terrigena]|uniref:GtrA family protein n=1 Tax=Paenibacillus terrigena TaxID=369333 RepID=UPI0028D156A0|nr:GtrA family protein [Paenibacillus terrigena]
MKNILRFQFIRFLIVGVLNTLVGLSTIFILYNVFQINYWLSTSIGNIIGGVCSYLLNRKYTFNSEVTVNKTFIKFIIVNILAYVVSYYLGYWSISQFKQSGIVVEAKIYENISLLLASGLFTVLNYIGHKYVTFNNKIAKKSS